LLCYYTILKTLGKSLVGSDVFGASLLEELKASRPKSPPPIQKPSGDEAFCTYLGSLMSSLPTTKKIRLQGELISKVIDEINN